MEINTIIIIVIMSILGCGIIGVGIYLIVEYVKHNKKSKSDKCLKGCYFKGESGNCGKPPCKKDKCPFTCAKLRVGEKGWCQYDKYNDGDPDMDCTGCGCK